MDQEALRAGGFEALRARIPDAAKDVRLNLSSLEKIDTLTPQQLWGSVLASALSARQEDAARAALAEARKRLDGPTIDAVRTAAALMAMNNVYYRTRHLLHDPEFD